MGAMDQLYQQLIIDHAKAAHGRGLASTFDGESFQVNPTCGDKVQLRVSMQPGEQSCLAAVSWQGDGCSISMASTSMMTELVVGLSHTGVEQVAEAMNQLMHSRGQGIAEEQAELLGDAIALEGVSLYPMRIKCALLGWMALKDALTKALAGDRRPVRLPEGI